MAFNYARSKATAERLLAKFGKDATLKQPGTATGPAYNPTPGAPTDYASTVVEVEFTVADRTGTLVQENDIKFMLSTTGSPEPDLKGTLTVDSTVYQIVRLMPKAPGPLTLFWYVHCRK